MAHKCYSAVALFLVASLVLAATFASAAKSINPKSPLAGCAKIPITTGCRDTLKPLGSVQAASVLCSAINSGIIPNVNGPVGVLKAGPVGTLPSPVEAVDFILRVLSQVPLLAPVGGVLCVLH